jgi:hypothetical protein
MSLTLALENMNGWTWNKCCSEAIVVGKKMGISTVNNAKTIEKWYRGFRGKRLFCIPLKSKHNLPPILDLNPDVCAAIKEYGRANLGTMSVELMSQYIHNVILPSMVEKEQREGNGSDASIQEISIQSILKKYGLTCICLSTVYRWVKKLGFNYEPRKKSYYVDGHERESTINYRWRFIERYLGYEQRMFRWIQITEKEAIDLETTGALPKQSGYRYESDTGVTMVEYHVDTCDVFQQRMNEETKYGGRRSIRYKEGKMLIIWGHDEAIIKQFTLTKKNWTGPNGETAIVPKDEGAGIMISAFQSREFGFGLHMSEQELALVNEYRRDKKYQDEEAAKAKRGDAKKKPLTKSPFILEFEYGASGEGYWVYEHMVLQLEDCTDCLKVLYPEHEFLFLLDHSCGHDRQRDDGLNVENMNKSYGGNKPKMRETTIQCEKGYLGPYRRQLQPGDVQRMVFTQADVGPFWMSDEEREKRRHDVILEGQVVKRKLTKKELMQILLTRGITMKGRLVDIQRAATNNGIPLEETSQKKIDGWEGKPKGLLQVLWERGWINNDDGRAYNNYTITGKKNEFNLIQPETSLKHLMASCTDFEEEETLLQATASKMGVLVDRSPKCHCEIAGEGIEYSWACAKNHYRQILLDKKRGKENFIKSVRECMSRDLITRQRVQKFSRRARHYILGYHILWQMKQGLIEGSDSLELQDDNSNSQAIIPAKLEQMVKKFKTHRCAMDFDHSFCKAIYREEESLP